MTDGADLPRPALRDDPNGRQRLAEVLARLGRTEAGLDVILVRHGESHANAGGEFVGRRDIALHPRGHDQADAAAPLLARLLGASAEPLVVASPLSRAATTARRIMPGAHVEIDERLVELDFGELEGRRFADLLADWPPAWIADPSIPIPGGESYDQLATRVAAALDDHGTAAAVASRPLVVISHLGVVKTVVGAVLGPTDAAAGGERFVVGYASLTRLRLRHDGGCVDTLNLTPPPT